MRNQMIGFCLTISLIAGIQCGASDRKPLVLIPKDGHVLVGQVISDKIDTIGQLPFPGVAFVDTKKPSNKEMDSLAVQATLYENIDCAGSEWITCTMRDGKMIGVARVTDSGINQLSDIVLEDDDQAFATTSINGLIYVGGYSKGGVMLAVYELFYDSSKSYWKRVFRDVMPIGKSIDALLIIDGLLIAVDNVVSPKWFLVYDLKYVKAPRFIGKIEIPFHGVWEQIYRVAFNNHFLVTLSSTSGQMSFSQHLAIFLLPQLKEAAVISNAKYAIRFGGYSELTSDTSVTWESINLFGDTLIIGAGENGIGLIDLNRLNLQDSSLYSTWSYSSSNIIKYRIKEQLSVNEIMGSSRKNINPNVITYIYPSSLPKGKVLNALPLLPVNKLCVLVDVDENLETIIIDVDELIPN